jgi:hypothetical protein
MRRTLQTPASELRNCELRFMILSFISLLSLVEFEWLLLLSPFASGSWFASAAFVRHLRRAFSLCRLVRGPRQPAQAKSRGGIDHPAKKGESTAGYFVFFLHGLYLTADL